MLLDELLLNKVSGEAKKSPRLRMNYNLHESLDDKVQRLFNAMEPGTIVPIQRHQDTAETLLVVKGELKLTIYDDSKNIIEQEVLNPSEGRYGYHIPKGVWHCVEVLAPNTVMFPSGEGEGHPSRRLINKILEIKPNAKIYVTKDSNFILRENVKVDNLTTQDPATSSKKMDGK